MEPIDTYSLVGFSYEINFGSLISDILSINPKYAASAKNKSGYFAGAAIPANVPYTASAELREFAIYILAMSKHGLAEKAAFNIFKTQDLLFFANGEIELNNVGIRL